MEEEKTEIWTVTGTGTGAGAGRSGFERQVGGELLGLAEGRRVIRCSFGVHCSLTAG